MVRDGARVPAAGVAAEPVRAFDAPGARIPAANVAAEPVKALETAGATVPEAAVAAAPGGDPLAAVEAAHRLDIDRAAAAAGNRLKEAQTVKTMAEARRVSVETDLAPVKMAADMRRRDTMLQRPLP